MTLQPHLAASALMACAALSAEPLADDAREQVAATERAFARTMAERDLTAFAGFIAEDAVFFSGERTLRGKAQVVQAWARFYAPAQAPFSWEPAQVEVLATGNLALSTGPVRDPAGQLMAHFTSVWRREASGAWRIVFDKGTDVCACARQPPP